MSRSIRAPQQLPRPRFRIAPFVPTYARYMHCVEPDNDWDDAARRVWLQMETDAREGSNLPLGQP